jgi:hypothetical protein
MGTSLLRVARFEVVRVLASTRWLWAALAWFAVAWLAADEVALRTMFADSGWWSVFDVHAAAGNNMLYLGFVLLTAFVLVCCDTLARDRETRLAHVILLRGGERRAWWTGKVVAVIVAALVFQAGFLATTVAVGAFKGAALTAESSPVARAEFGEEAGSLGDPLFTPADEDTNMLVRELVMSGYLAMAFAAIGVALLALTVRHPHSWVPVTVALGVVIADRIVGWFVRADWYALVSPTLRLMEAMHSPQIVQGAIPWWTTIVWWLVLGMGSFLTGRYLLARADV